VLVENEQTALPGIDLNRIRGTLRKIRAALGYGAYGVSLALVDDGEMRRTNLETRGVDRPTDILSFPLLDAVEPGTLADPPFDVPDYYNLGDMMVDVPYVIRRCREDYEENNNMNHIDDDGGGGDEADETERGVSGAMSTIYDAEDRIQLLLVHGVLHLLGHDHETDDDFERMVSEEERLIRELELIRKGNNHQKQPDAEANLSYSAAAGAVPSSFAVLGAVLSRQDAAALLDNALLPKREYGRRAELGRDAQNVSDGQLLSGFDPVLALTYGEFPLASVDSLLDCASKYCNNNGDDGERHLNVVDLGSGCGRVCLYLALSRRNWSVTGIEISDSLHRESAAALARARDDARLEIGGDTEGGTDDGGSSCSALAFLHGPADAFRDSAALRDADLIFCYSTAWRTSHFSQQIGAMILDDYWNQLLSSPSCKEGCVVVTTDRALDPSRGWILLDKLDVDNPEVGGSSTGYVQQLPTGSGADDNGGQR